MDNSQQYIAPAANTAPQAPTTVQGLAASVANSANDPGVTTANANANTAMQTANSSQATDYTLPQLLQQALTPLIGKTGSGDMDPDVAKHSQDLGQYLGDLSNPTRLLESATPEGVVLSPQQQRDIISGRLGSESANISTDNFLTGLRSGGIATIIKNLAAQHQQSTQQLFNTAALAKQIADQALSKAQLHQQGFESAANLLNASRGLDLQEKGLALNPLAAARASHAEMQKLAPGMSFKEFMGKYQLDPALQGMSATQAYEQYKNSGGKGTPTQEDFQQYPDLNAGMPQQQGAAWLTSLLKGGEGATTAVNNMIPAAGVLATISRGLGGPLGGLADLFAE